MTIRTTLREVTFRHPFRLDALEGEQPAGVYEIATDEEQVEDISFLAYRRVATTIRIERHGAAQVFPIDPVELEASLLSDAGLTVPPAGRA